MRAARLVGALALLTAIPAETRAAEPALDGRIVSLLSSISEERLQKTLATLVGFETRNTLSNAESKTRGVGAARQWILDEMKAASPRLQVSFDGYDIPKQGQRIVRDATVVNVVAVLPGKSPRRLYVSGHYDSLARSAPAAGAADATGFDWGAADNIAPGANDDGSGSALTIELARVFAQSGIEFDATLVFACFAGEEQGLIGAKLHAQQAAAEKWPIEAVLNNDIVGNSHGGGGSNDSSSLRVFSEGPEDSASRAIARYVQRQAAFYTPGHRVRLVARHDRFGRGGDHTALNQHGFPGVRISESTENYARQHTVADTLDGVDFAYLARNARVNAAALATMGLAPPPPVLTTDPQGRPQLGRQPSGYDARLRWKASPGAAGYRIFWRDAWSADWQHELAVGDVNETVLKGISIDDYVFGVAAVSAGGHESVIAAYVNPPRPSVEIKTAPGPSALSQVQRETGQGLAGLTIERSMSTPSERPPAASVDSVREELRRLGYFESGIDRFVLGGAAPSSSGAAAWRVAWRIGIVGGGVFGIALTLLAVSLEPQGSIDARDLGLLFVYLGAIAFVMTSLVTMSLGLLTARLARGAPGQRSTLLPRIVSAALAGGGALYLVFWWRSHGAAAAPATQAIFLLIGAAVSGLLGRFGALASVAVLTGAGAIDRVPQAALSRRHLLPLFFVCAAVLLGSLAMARRLEARASETPDFAVVPTGLRVRVVGIDGFERRMAEQMIARGEAPQLAALLERSARATLRAEPEQVPAIVWTTIATSRGPEAHGIRSAGMRRLPGMTAAVPIEAGRFASAFARATEMVRLTRQAPPSALLRGAKTFWNVASEKGLRVGVVNWWATWPADPVNGFIVSDRAFLKLEKAGTNEGDVHPDAAFAKLRALAAAAAPTRPRQLDVFHAQALRALSQETPPDLEAVYLNGLDVFTMQTLASASANVADLDARLEAVRGYYRFLDEQLGRLAEGVGPLQVLVVVGDPGRFARRSDKDAAGLLLIAGGPAVAQELAAASERDIAPTVLHLAGLPASRELTGRVIEQALDPGFRKTHPVRFVDGYGRRPRSRPAESAFDKDVLEELRSLGYIQ